MIYKGFIKDWIAEYKGRAYIYATKAEAEAGLAMLKKAVEAVEALRK